MDSRRNFLSKLLKGSVAVAGVAVAKTLVVPTAGSTPVDQPTLFNPRVDLAAQYRAGVLQPLLDEKDAELRAARFAASFAALPDLTAHIPGAGLLVRGQDFDVVSDRAIFDGSLLPPEQRNVFDRVQRDERRRQQFADWVRGARRVDEHFATHDPWEVDG